MSMTLVIVFNVVMSLLAVGAAGAGWLIARRIGFGSPNGGGRATWRGPGATFSKSPCALAASGRAWPDPPAIQVRPVRGRPADPPSHAQPLARSSRVFRNAAPARPLAITFGPVGVSA